MTPPEREGAALEAGIVSPAAAELAAFYVDALGFRIDATLTFEQGSVFRLRNGSAQLKIFQPTEPAATGRRPEPWHADSGFAYAALHVPDAQAAYERAVGAGATPKVEPTAHRPGARFALLADPEGNVWELLEETT